MAPRHGRLLSLVVVERVLIGGRIRIPPNFFRVIDDDLTLHT